MKAPLPEQEPERLAALERYAILDTLPEDAFDRLAALAADLLDAPVAVINFIDQKRQWGKAIVGMDDSEAPRQDSFCAWTILGDDVLVIPDAWRDERFRDNPMVTGEPHVRLYAGAPLTTPDGHRIGSLCVTDPRPRDLTARDTERLRRLAGLVMDELEHRREMVEHARHCEALELMNATLRRRFAFSEALLAVHDLVDLVLPPEEALLHGAALVGRHVTADVVALVEVRQGGDATMHTAWHAAKGRAFVDAAGETMRREDGGVVFEVAEQGGARFVDDYASVPGRNPRIHEAGGQTLAWAFVGEHDGARFVLVCTRVHEGQPWTPQDRTLVKTAARALSLVLSRTVRVDALTHEAFQDPLTSLGNRRALQRDLAALNPTGGVAVVDLDGLKGINDVQGHARGDALLRLFASTLAGEVPAGTMAYRLGGDEFVLLTPHAPPRWDEAAHDAVRLALSFVRNAGFERVGASCGAALASEPGDPLALADVRMYEDKRRRQARDAPEDVSANASRQGERRARLRVVGRAMHYRRRVVALTPKEAAILDLLASRPGQVYSRAEIVRRVWSESEHVTGNLVDVHITALRRKLSTLTRELAIRAQRGKGYVLEDA